MKTAGKILAALGILGLLGGLIVVSYSLIRPEPSNPNPKVDSETKAGLIRKANFAGTFYPAGGQELTTALDVFFVKTQKTVGAKPRILIVPHAGVNYSGLVAASGFKQLEGYEYSKIIILGPSHTSVFDYAAIFPEGTWETPLGSVNVDSDLASLLIDEEKNIKGDAPTHEKEHSLELELIFLQKSLKNFSIVPILVGNASGELLENLAEKISGNFDENTLLVISSDLSHYPDWQTANSVDGQTIKAILSGKEEGFVKTLDKEKEENFSNLETSACGSGAIRVALKVAEKLKIKDFQEIKYANSGDITGNKTKVVGYAAIVGLKDKLESPNLNLSSEAEKEALEIARKTLESYLGSGNIPSLVPVSSELQKPLGAFVTLTKNGNLRGCIGEFEPKDPLYKIIQRTAISAATKDTRFTPVGASELKNIEIEISVMTPREKIADWKAIRLGKDGVVIQKGLNSGTFLPQVASDTGWGLEKFLAELCSQKAGLPTNCYQDPGVTFYIFGALVFKE